MSASETHAGGCLCSGVRFTVAGPLRGVVNCHCGQCRRFHGHHGAYSWAPRDKVTFTADASLRWYDSSEKARRGFCSVCGASLFWQGRGKNELSISAGCLDEPTGLTTTGDIFVADKGDYYTIEPGRASWPQSSRAS